MLGCIVQNKPTIVQSYLEQIFTSLGCTEFEGLKRFGDVKPLMYTLCNTVEGRERNLEESRTSFFLQMQNRIQEGESFRLGVGLFFFL